MPSPFAGALALEPLVKFGERPSVFDFLPSALRLSVRDGSITADVTGYIQDGLDSVAAAGGGLLYLPWGVYPVTSLDVPSKVHLIGDETGGTVLKRFDDLATGRGMVNFAGAHAGLRGIAIDGQVTTPTAMTYASMTDPMADPMTANSSIWIASGAEDIYLGRIRVFHTGGYAVLLDARTGNIRRVLIEDSEFANKRPHIAGATLGTAEYGHWTGGILAEGDGYDYAVHGLHVDRSRFRRGNGNQVWSHLYAFEALHSDFRVTNSTFVDIARDGVMPGGVIGGDVSGNHFRRIGYVCPNDSDAAVPKADFANGQWAVAIDTSGLVRGVSYRGNNILNAFGGSVDADGLADAVVAENTIRVSKPGEPEYDEDSVGSWGGALSYGFNLGNTSNQAAGARGVVITGNRFANLGLGAIRLYAGRDCTVYGNNIDHPDAPTYAPILLGNIGSGANQRAYGNAIYGNDIHWSPGSAAAAIQEDASVAAFSGSDKNWVGSNRVYGSNVFEFTKAASSASTTARVDSSNKSGLASRSENSWQREDGYYRLYRTTASGTDVFATIIDGFTAAGGGAAGPFFNLSKNAVGGVFGTGPRTTAAWDDAVVTGKLFADSMLVLAETTYSASDGNVLSDAYGLIRYDATAKRFKQSTAVSSGVRVWTDLGGGTPAGSSSQLQFNNSGAFGASSSLVWDDTLKRQTITGLMGTPGLVLVDSYVQAAQGFYTPSSNSDAIQAPSGGVTALSLISIRNDGSAGLTLSRTSSTARTYGWGIDSSGNLFLRDVTAGANRLTLSTAGLFTIGSSVAIDQAGNLTATALLQAAGLNVSGSSYNSIQAPSGGMYAALGFTADQGLYLKSYASSGSLNTPGAGYGGMGHKSGTQYWIYNGSSWVTVDFATVGGGVTSITGTANQVIASAATGAVTLSLPQSIHTGASPTFANLYATSTIGIGTGSPSSPLQVHAPDTAGTYGAILSGGRTAGGWSGILLRNSYWTNNGSAGAAAIYALDSGSSGGHLVFATTANGGGTTGTPSERMRISSAGLISFNSATLQIDASGNLTAAAVVQAAGANISGSSYNSLQVPSGGLYTGLGVTVDQALYPKTLASAPNNPGAGYGGFSHKLGATYRYWNGSAWADCNLSAIGSSQWANGSSSSISYSSGLVAIGTASPPSSTLGYALLVRTGADQNWQVRPNAYGTGAGVLFQASNDTDTLSVPMEFGASGFSFMVGNVKVGTVTDDGSGAKLQINGFARATTGFAVSASTTTTDAIQATGGGVTAKYLIGTSSLTLTTDGSAGLSTSGNARLRFDGTNLQLSVNGGAYASLTGGGGGVASLNSQTGALTLAGTSNRITISNVGGAFTLTAPQDLHTSAAMQLYSLLTSDAIQSNRSTGPAIYAPNAYIQAKGLVSNGLAANNSIQSDYGITAGTGFWVGSTQVVNGSGTFIGAGVNVGSNGISAGGYNVNGGYLGQTWNVVGSFTISGVPYTTLIFRGGVLVSAS